jgi:NarL family two-component system sensor histidine kinase YdfH
MVKRLTTLLQNLRILREKNSPSENVVEWPFFIILTFAFAFVYIQSIISNSALREPARLILFTILMNVHVILHWFSVRLWKWNQVAIYVIVQSVLAFTVVYLGATISAILALYMGLIGETIGLLREKPRWMSAAVAVLLGLSFLNYILQVGWAAWYWWLLAMLPMTIFVAVYVILYARQAEARQQAQTLLRDLEAANRQLSDYAAQVEDLTLAAERQRMARELHDTLSQGLAGLILQLEAVDAHLASQRVERGRTILQQSMEKARGTLAEARQAIDNLRRPLEHDLVEIIQQEADHFTNTTGIPCEPQIDLKVDVPEVVAEAAGKAVSEGLTNIARHAQAKNVTLRMSGESKGLEIEICDDGVGFDPETVQTGHYGLVGMRERVRLAGGSLEVQSANNKGTCVKISFPLDNDAQAGISGNTPQES